MSKPTNPRPPAGTATDGEAGGDADGGAGGNAGGEGGPIVLDATTAAGLRACLVHLQREAEGRGYALTAHLLAVASDAVLEDAPVPGAGRPN